MKRTIRRRYQQFRKSGYRALESLRNAKITDSFYELECTEEVRLVSTPEFESYFSVYGEPEGYTNQYGKRVTAEEERKEICDLIESNGSWIVESQYRNPYTGEWEFADSIGFCIYSNPQSEYENCYVPDLMIAAMDQLKTAKFEYLKGIAKQAEAA